MFSLWSSFHKVRAVSFSFFNIKKNFKICVCNSPIKVDFLCTVWHLFSFLNWGKMWVTSYVILIMGGAVSILIDTEKRPCSWQALAVPPTTAPAIVNLNMHTSVTLSIFTSLGNTQDSASNKTETLAFKQQFLKTNKNGNNSITPPPTYVITILSVSTDVSTVSTFSYRRI